MFADATRAAIFSEKLLNDVELSQIIEIGKEYGVTTGRKRKVNWLNLDLLIKAINISGTTHLIISKIDVLEKLCKYKIIHNDTIISYDNMSNMKKYINSILISNCLYIKDIIYSIKSR